jgi:hypothetical protein
LDHAASQLPPERAAYENHVRTTFGSTLATYYASRVGALAQMENLSGTSSAASFVNGRWAFGTENVRGITIRPHAGNPTPTTPTTTPPPPKPMPPKRWATPRGLLEASAFDPTRTFAIFLGGAHLNDVHEALWRHAPLRLEPDGNVTPLTPLEIPALDGVAIDQQRFIAAMNNMGITNYDLVSDVNQGIPTPTHDDFVHAFPKNLPNNSTLLLFVSTHGMMVNKSGILVLSSDASRDHAVEITPWGLLEPSEMARLALSTGAGHIQIFLDTCTSGAFVTGDFSTHPTHPGSGRCITCAIQCALPAALPPAQASDYLVKDMVNAPCDVELHASVTGVRPAEDNSPMGGGYLGSGSLGFLSLYPGDYDDAYQFAHDSAVTFTRGFQTPLARKLGPLGPTDDCAPRNATATSRASLYLTCPPQPVDTPGTPCQPLPVQPTGIQVEPGKCPYVKPEPQAKCTVKGSISLPTQPRGQFTPTCSDPNQNPDEQDSCGADGYSALGKIIDQGGAETYCRGIILQNGANGLGCPSGCPASFYPTGVSIPQVCDAHGQALPGTNQGSPTPYEVPGPDLAPACTAMVLEGYYSSIIVSTWFCGDGCPGEGSGQYCDEWGNVIGGSSGAAADWLDDAWGLYTLDAQDNAWADALTAGVDAALGATDATLTSDTSAQPITYTTSTSVSYSLDPNDLEGPTGVGTQHYVGPRQPLSYQVQFENEANATASARSVTLHDTLDPALDPNSILINDLRVGGASLDGLPRAPPFTSRLDLRDTTGLDVDVIVTLDPTTRDLRIDLLPIDPTTNAPPLNTTIGFLPPETGRGTGIGLVNYTVTPIPVTSDGDRISAQASIIFDTNSPVNTPTRFATLDSLPPHTTLEPLPTTSPGPNITVNWSANDNQSGVLSYDTFVSIDGGPLQAWLTNTTNTASTYSLSPGHAFGFAARATDNVGNTEPTPTTAQATTRVAPQASSASPVTHGALLWTMVAVTLLLALIAFVILSRRR